MERVPVIALAGLSEVQRRALIVADNKLALNADWDFGILQDELGALDMAEFDLGILGFTDDELEQVATWTPEDLREGHAPPDVAPERPSTPVSRAGDLWVLGDHRVICGDATKGADVARLLAGATPGLMVTDPPYGVDYDPAWRNAEAAKGNLAYAARRVGVVANDHRADWREAWALFSGDVAYCWHAGARASQVQQSLEAAGFEIRSQIIWSKSNFPISRGHYHWRHEPCWYAVRKGGTGNWHGDRKQTTVWQINLDPNVEGGHSTQKPVECMRRPIENNSAVGDAVYDPFVGSGTTIIAAEQSRRRCFALELDPGYADVAVQRWQAFAAADATLEGDGRTFDAIRAAGARG
jgi:DNA modification methylase